MYIKLKFIKKKKKKNPLVNPKPQNSKKKKKHLTRQVDNIFYNVNQPLDLPIHSPNGHVFYIRRLFPSINN